MTIEQGAAGAGAGTDTGTENPGGGQDTGKEQGGTLKGNSLMTTPGAEEGKGGEGKPDAGKDTGKEQGGTLKDDPAGKVPDKPEGYSLTFGKEISVDKELLGTFQKTAHELGIPQGKAQKLADMYAANAAKAWDRVEAERVRVIEEAKKGWEAEIEKSPNFVKERAHIQAALKEYGDQELYDLLDQTNLGSHPKMWAFMARIGKELAEPGFRGKGGSKEEPPLAARMWPNM